MTPTIGRDDRPARDLTTTKVVPQDAGVQTLRGIACLLVVALHVVGFSPSTGMQMGEGTFYRNMADLFAPLRIPLFTFLSGFVYAYHPVIAGRVGEFATKKLRRLAWPLLTLTTIYWLLTFVAGDVNGKVPVSEAWRIYVFPYVHLWFLQAIMLIFAGTIVLERLGALATPQRFAATLLCAALAGAAVGGFASESVFSYQGAIYLLPFFLLGVGANRYRALILRPQVAWACAIVLLVSAAVHFGFVQQVGVPTPRLLVLVVGFSGVLALSYFTPRWRPFERIGAYSFSIYLLHPFAVAPTRKTLQALDLDPAAALFGFGLLVGIVAPIVFEHLARRVPAAQRMLLGQSPKRAASAPLPSAAALSGR
jgi:peptidoglycan/LPS O-acetylase OafA/YrhL